MCAAFWRRASIEPPTRLFDTCGRIATVGARRFPRTAGTNKQSISSCIHEMEAVAIEDVHVAKKWAGTIPS